MASGPNTKNSLDALLTDALLRLKIVERRIAIGGGGGGSTFTIPAGVVAPYGGDAVPSGWLLCDGTAVLRGVYPALFAAIGTTWGAGDGSTTFNLPDFRGRTLVGRDASQAEFDTLGETGGEKTHTLTVDEMPTHSHTMSYQGGSYSQFSLLQNVQSPHSTVGWGAGAPFSPNRPIGINNAGGGDAHNNLQPYAVTEYIISTGVTGGGGGTPDDTGWIALTLLNSFTAGPSAPAIRVKNGVAYLRGTLYRASAPASFTTAFDIPSPYGPDTQFRVRSREDFSLEFAVTTGSVQVVASTPATTGVGYPLTGISWIPAGM